MEKENYTPMLIQYHSIKNKYPDCLLFFRLGDFYEMFYEDAKIASKILDLVLTSKNAGKSGKIPMCGIPYHASDTYISKLIKLGYKVAICEQVEDPKKAKGIVKREVIRVLTSGTYIDETNPDARYLFSLCPDEISFGYSFIESGSSTIFTNQTENEIKLIETIFKLPVYEVIYPESKKNKIKEIFSHPLLKMKNITLTELDDWHFNYEISKKTVLETLNVSSLKGFGIENLYSAQKTIGALIDYLKETNKSNFIHIDKISFYNEREFVYISPSAINGLEIEKLIEILDNTKTPLGKRLLKYWVLHPLVDLKEIKKRQEIVEILIKNKSLRENIGNILSDIRDTEKSLSKISYGYGSIKDIVEIKKLVRKIPQIFDKAKEILEKTDYFEICDVVELRNLLDKAIDENIPSVNFEGKIIKTGFNEEIDRLREIKENSEKYLAKYQEEEIKRTGINSLKIGYNKVFGYYIEITKANLKFVPGDYIRKQTLVNAERFITPELKEFEQEILTAEEKIITLENEIIEKVKEEILKNAHEINILNSTIAKLDVLLSFANISIENEYNKPLIDESFIIEIKEGRHPVVEKAVAEFIPNDTYIDRNNHLLIITGPNMAGKSTYIRQVALIVLLAQIGCFVPAKSAKIGYIDKIFTRIGAQDELTKGQSTFMVEMTETAEILNNLSERTLIILDEIGRGTSTYDGFSLAWAVAEFLYKTKVRTLFATHFHEITALGKYKGVKNYNVAVKKSGDEIIFLHKIMEGATDESYGIYVAKLAGVPENVIKRANEILSKLELEGAIKDKIIGEVEVEYPSLFSIEEKSKIDELKEEIKKLENIKTEIKNIDIENLKPIEALLKLKELKEKINGKG
ncbi:MAG: DNA mismatch repair protein MutS [Candidatus Omnitrophica bacterium]|nr:DNA mismatch repair protein MutS [Candidatus Omnitrophota bacterium]